MFFVVVLRLVCTVRTRLTVDFKELICRSQRFLLIFEVDRSLAQLKKMLINHLILYRILVPVEVGFFHVVSNRPFESLAFLPCIPLNGYIDHSFDVVAIESVLGEILRITQGFRLLLQFFLGGDGERTIHIELKI